jgi:chromosome partitioning protein
MAGEMLLDEKCQLRCENTKRTMHDLLTVMLELEFIRTRFNSFVTHKASNIGGGLANLAVFPCSKRIDDISTNMAKAHHGHRSNDDFLRMLSKRRK